MPQQLLHHLELSPHASQQGRVGVTERMPSESLLNSDSLSCRTYVFAQDPLAPVRSSASIALACKNPVLRPDVGTTFSPLRQSVRESRMHWRSEEHTSELQSHSDLVCRLLLEKKKKN